MESLSYDIIQKIYSFLSIKEKIYMREVCSYLKSNVKTRYISVYSLESKIPNIYSIVYKQGIDLVLTVNNNFILYTPVDKRYIHSKLNYRFVLCNNSQYKKCIVENCSKQQMKDIFITQNRNGIPQYLRTCYYYKRKMPYCIHCFNLWGIDAYLNHCQKKKM
jgi:hypothetical protein